MTDKSRRKDRFSVFVTIFGIVVFSISVILLACVLYDRFFSLKFPLLINLLTNPTLYALFFFIALIVCFALTSGKKTVLKAITVVIVIIGILPLSFVLLLGGGKKVSMTDDIENYGIYDKLVDEDLKIFPAEITEDMTPIKYSYYYDWTWDHTYEIYLEVRMGADAYDKLKAEYSDSLSDFRYADGYEEFVISDNLKAELKDGDYYTSNGSVIKIIFNDAENIVIFEYLDGDGEPMKLEDSAYIERFNIELSQSDR